MKSLLALLLLVFLVGLVGNAHASSEANDEHVAPRNAFVIEARVGAAYQSMLSSLFVGARVVDRIHLGLGGSFERWDYPVGGATTSDGTIVSARSRSTSF